MSDFQGFDGSGGSRVQRIPLDAVNLEDTTFRFRAALREGPLARSLEADGQQVPIVVRRRSHGRGRWFQVICGFRRATAARSLGWTEIAAIVRDDLEDDEAAFKVSVLENTARRTYSDIDRALVIKSYEERDYGSREIADLMGLSKRQKNNLRSLLELPEEVQAALDDVRSVFKTTHALVLMKLKRAYPDLEFGPWIAMVEHEALSVARLKRRVNAKLRGASEAGFSSIYNPAGTDLAGRRIRLMPVKLELDAMSSEERKRLKAELLSLAGML